jgi:diguanylate cyclase (GGDEF)-like protein
MKLSAISRITMGLVSLAVTLLLAADLLFGLFPSEGATNKAVQVRMAQSLATLVATLVQRRDWVAIEQTFRAVQADTDDVSSIGLRHADGRLVAQTAGHPATWEGVGKGWALNVTVPLMARGAAWGQLEVAYRAPAMKDLPAWALSGPSRLVLLFMLVASTTYYLYLRRMLEHLDPAAAVPDRVRNAFDTLIEGVVVVDLLGRILLVNKAFSALRPPGDERPLVGQRAQALDWLHPAYPETDPTPWLTTVSSRQSVRGLRFEVRAEGDTEARAHVTLNCSPLHDERGGLQGCMVSVGDVTELEVSNQQLMDVLADLAVKKDELVKKNEALELLANHDPLSGCLNRRAFFAQGQAQFERATYDGSALVCVMADIDHFKRINDTWGHSVGDQAIQRFAQLLRQQVRPGDLLGRYGGEEFCLVLPGADAERGRRLAEVLRQAVAANNGEGLDPGPQLTMSASFGVAVIDPTVSDLAGLVDLADRAMYVAKKSGRNRVVVFSAELAASVAAAEAAPALETTAASPSATPSLRSAPPPPAQEIPVLTSVLMVAPSRAAVTEEP